MVLGPRRGVTFLLWVTTPAIFGIMFVQNAAGWIACRCIIGLSLATFVCSQVWCSQMYAKSVVGIANATSAGWGNLGGGVTNLLMPYIFLGFYGAVSGTSAEKEDLSWRLCYLVPLAMHISGGFFALTARDLATYDGGRWRKAVGEFRAVVGASSRDHRLEASFAV